MAHTTFTKNHTFIHNGDFSGEVTIVQDNEVKLKIDFEELKAFMAEYVRSDLIGTIEQMNPDELLRGLK